MTTPTHQRFKSIYSGWALWFFPVIAVVICAWLFFDYYQKRGPVITIKFDDASGLQAEKTRVRYRGVTIGIVKTVKLSDDAKDVIATINLQKEAELFAVEGSKFWVVVPKVTFQGVTGLDTLFEGTYIDALPGLPENPDQRDFKASVNSESTNSLENTTAYFLETSNAESVSAGDAVTFRGIAVGSVTKVTLSKNSQVVVVQLNMHNKYIKLIRTHTVFWRKIGIQAKLGLFGSEVKINSMDSIMRGGVEFFNPDDAGEIAKAGSRYNLSSAPPKDYEKWNPKLE